MEVPHPGPPVERIREVYVDRPKPVEVEVLREVPIEVVKEVPVEVIKEVTREVFPQSRPPPQEQAPRRPSSSSEPRRPRSSRTSGAPKLVPSRPRQRGTGHGGEPVRVSGGYKVWDGERGGPNVGLFRGYMPRGGASRSTYSNSRVFPMD